MNRYLHIQNLPLEVVINIFGHLPYNQICTLINECLLFQKAACLHMKFSIVRLKNVIQSELHRYTFKLRNVPLNEEHLRIDYMKSLLSLRMLSTEVDVLIAKVWRYTKCRKAWIILCPLLSPVLNQFEEVISSQTQDSKRLREFNSFTLPIILNEFYNFLNELENNLEDVLHCEAREEIPFETKVIDILTCCPSINFQLGLQKKIDKKHYHIYGFFKFPGVKPIFQVPDVHNSQLTNEQKRKKVLKYLRESIQWSNATFLNGLINRIIDLEMGLLIYIMTNEERNFVINKIQELYGKITENPYQPILKSIDLIFDGENTIWNEYYLRINSYNINLTGLTCIIDIPHYDTRWLPLSLPYLRGRRTIPEQLETFEVDLTKVGSHFCMNGESEQDDSIFLKAPDIIEMRPKLQMIIHYREGLNSTPAEAIVELGYNDLGEPFLITNNIQSEPFEDSLETDSD